MTFMPLGIEKLTNLRDLTDFHVGEVSSIGKRFGGQLEDLKLYVNLRGALDIRIHKNLASEMENKWEGGYLEHIKNLKVVRIYFPYRAGETNNDEAEIEKLQPNRNLMELSLWRYRGVEIPRWGRAHDDWAIILPNLVKITLEWCKRLHGIPLLSNLKHLKSLTLSCLDNLEYMETSTISRGSYGSKDIPFFPSLEYLRIVCLEKLIGWWGGVGWQPTFPRLSRLEIISCPKLSSLPPCPSLESLVVKGSNKAFRVLLGEGPANSNLKLRVEDIDNVDYLSTLPAFRLTHIFIKRDRELKSLSEIEEVFKSSSSLRSLTIESCVSLTSVSGALEHLTALESLSLVDLRGLVADPNDMPWRSLRHNLRYLELKLLHNLQMLPRGMRHLTALENLSIAYCNSLRGLPEWVGCLSSLHSLTIYGCDGIKSLGAIQTITSLQELYIMGRPDLREACREPSGQEWPKIRHIPHFYVN